MRKAGRESRVASTSGNSSSRGDTQHFSRTGITAVFRPYSWKGIEFYVDMKLNKYRWRFPIEKELVVSLKVEIKLKYV